MHGDHGRLLTALIDHLIDEEAALARLEAALQMEQGALKALDHEGLRAALIEKKVVSSEQQILEAARLRHLTHVAAQCMGRDGAPTLREIIDAVGEPWASQITEIRSQLQRRLGRVRQLHEANRALALSGQRTVSQALGHLGRKRADTYATNGQIRHGSVKRSVVVL